MIRILTKKEYKVSFPLWLAFIACIFSFSAGYAQTVTPEQALEIFLESTSLNKNQTAVFVWDLEADYQVASYRAANSIVPASVMKCVTVAELQSCVDPKDQIITRVFIDGKVSDGKLNGNIVIKGAGDPSLGDGRHKNQADFIDEIISALGNKGISEIAGTVVIDDELFQGSAVHPSWPEADLSQSYGTGCHAFNFEGNASGKVSVKNPSDVFIRKLKGAMSAAGISLAGKNLDSGNSRQEILLEYKSPALGTLMRSCMFRSDNLYAETFLRLFGVNNGCDGSVESSASVAMQHWDALNYPLAGVYIADGSGLSRENSLTAEFLGSVLIGLKDDPDYLTYFPLVGEEGTVRNFMKDTPLQGRMALKTGSMNGIQSYAGYVLDEDYFPTHAVVVMTNDLKNRDNYRKALAKFFLTLFE